MANKSYLQIIIKRILALKWLLLVVALLFSCSFYLLSKKFPRTYTATSRVFPLNSTNNVGGLNTGLSTILGNSGGTGDFTADAAINIVDLANSRDILQKIVSEKIPGFGNQSIAEILIKDYNKYTLPWQKKIVMPTNQYDLQITGSQLLRECLGVTISKTNVLEISLSNTNQHILTPVSILLIQYISDYYTELKVFKARIEYDFSVKKLDSINKVLMNLDRRAIQIANSTMFTTPGNMNYEIPKENVMSEKLRVNALKTIASNNMEAALWKLQKLTPIMKILDYPYPPFNSTAPSSMLFAIGGFILGLILAIFFAIWDLIYKMIMEKLSGALNPGNFTNNDVTTTVTGKEEVIYTPTSVTTSTTSSRSVGVAPPSPTGPAI